MTVLGLCLLWSALQATLLGLVAVLLGARPWRVGGSFTPLLTLLAIALLTVCSVLPLPGWWPEISLNRSISLNSVQAGTDSPQKVDASLTALPASLHAASEPVPGPPIAAAPSSYIVDLMTSFAEELKSVRSHEDRRWTRSSVPLWVLGIFLLGASVGFLRLILGLLGARDIRKRSTPIADLELFRLKDALCAQLDVPASVELRQANELTSAATVGYIRPAVLLPAQWASWQPHEIRAVLAHELAHIHHRDFAAQVLAQLGLILHFYNPVVHWLAERMKLEQELAADAIAASLAGGRQQYLRVLATMALDHDKQTVGWPARAFLPTRHSFLRRLEMLRVSKGLPARPRLPARVSAWTIIVGLTVLLITLRPAATSSAGAANGAAAAFTHTELTTEAPQTRPTVEADQSQAYDLRYLNEDAELVFGAKPTELLNNKNFQALYEAFGEKVINKAQSTLPLKPEDVQQLVVGLQPLTANSCIFIRLAKPMNVTADMVKGKAIELSGRSVFELGPDLLLWQPDERTIVINTRNRITRFIEGRSTMSAFSQSKAWAQVNQEAAFVIATGKLARNRWDMEKNGANSVIQTVSMFLSPVVDEAAFLGVAASVNSQLRLNLVAECQDEKGTARVRETIAACVILLKNSVKQLQSSAAGNTPPTSPDPASIVDARKAVAQFTDLASKALEGLDTRTEGTLVSVALQLSEKDFPGELLQQVVGSARRAAQRQTSVVNMKQIALGIHNYHGTNEVLPQSAITKVKKNDSPQKYPYSWRVAILPFIEQGGALYQKYKFDEPWDSPSNSELLRQMPACFRHPDDPADSTHTSYVVLSGPSTAFPLEEPLSFGQITDGASNTIMVVEAKTAIPWTKPEDLSYAADKAIPALGGYSKEGYNVAMVDGSVHFFSKELDPQLLRKIITARSGDQ